MGLYASRQPTIEFQHNIIGTDTLSQLPIAEFTGIFIGSILTFLQSLAQENEGYP